MAQSSSANPTQASSYNTRLRAARLIGLEVSDLAASASNSPVARLKAACHFATTATGQRIIVEQDPADDLDVLGWQVADETAVNEVASQHWSTGRLDRRIIARRCMRR